MSIKSITVLGFTAALITFGAAPASAHVNATASVAEVSEASPPRLDVAPSNYRRGGFSGGRSVSFRRASVRHVSFHRHHFARTHVRFGGGHRATPTRLAYNGRARYPRVTYNTRVQTPRIQSPRRANWRNHPLLNIRSG